jgi:hypothetical protein
MRSTSACPPSSTLLQGPPCWRTPPRLLFVPAVVGASAGRVNAAAALVLLSLTLLLAAPPLGRHASRHGDGQHAAHRA